jgi:GLPGLI family protein
MGKRLFISLIGFIFILGWMGCTHTDEKFIAEGTIEYAASVVDQSNPMAGMAPSKMTIKFKNNKSCAEMSAGMGLFTTSFISDPEKKSLIQLVKLLNKKFSMVMNEAALKKENELFNMEIIPSKQTKIIAGYKCEKATVHYKAGDFTDFDIFYTKELNIKNSNFANPFYMIDGVLMEYQMTKSGMEMKFVATSVKKEDIDDSVFELPADYKLISSEEMNTMLLGLQ